MNAARTLSASLGSAVALTLGDKLLLLGALLLVLAFVLVILGNPTRSNHLIEIIKAVRGRTDPDPSGDPSDRRCLLRDIEMSARQDQPARVVSQEPGTRP